MATPSSGLAWEILWIEEPGGLQSMGLQKNQTQLAHTQTRVYKRNSQRTDKIKHRTSEIQK